MYGHTRCTSVMAEVEDITENALLVSPRSWFDVEWEAKKLVSSAQTPGSGVAESERGIIGPKSTSRANSRAA